LSADVCRFTHENVTTDQLAGDFLRASSEPENCATAPLLNLAHGKITQEFCVIRRADAMIRRMLARVDNLDRSILDLLRQNARAGYGDIGSVVGLSASAVKRRVDRLVADGVIRGFTIQVDPTIDGMSTEAYVELFCRGTVAPDELLRILSAVPEVVDAGTVTGSADAIVHIRSRDIPSLEAALERVRLAPNVDHTRSAIVLSRLIHRGHD
jgi:DNA-binding Lrp family transcriptional regulator